MTITYTFTWAGGLANADDVGFQLTDPDGNVKPWIVSPYSIGNCPDPVARAVADELANQGGSATGTVTVSIA